MSRYETGQHIRFVEYYILYGGMWNLFCRAGHYSTGTQNLEKNLPCNAEDNLHAGLIVIEAWFRGY